VCARLESRRRRVPTSVVASLMLAAQPRHLLRSPFGVESPSHVPCWSRAPTALPRPRRAVGRLHASLARPAQTAAPRQHHCSTSLASQAPAHAPPIPTRLASSTSASLVARCRASRRAHVPAPDHPFYRLEARAYLSHPPTCILSTLLPPSSLRGKRRSPIPCFFCRSGHHEQSTSPLPCLLMQVPEHHRVSGSL
jgi:hypothetical protein